MNGFTQSADECTQDALACPTEDDARIAVDAAKFRFQRVLGAWASDCLELRRTGRTALVWDRAHARTRACETVGMTWADIARDAANVGVTSGFKAAA